MKKTLNILLAMASAIMRAQGCHRGQGRQSRSAPVPAGIAPVFMYTQLAWRCME